MQGGDLTDPLQIWKDAMAIPIKLTLAPSADWLKKLGVGIAIGAPSLLLADMVEHGALSAAAITQIVAWGPAALILVGLYLLIERWMPRVIAGQAAAVATNQKLADSVAMIADRGDRDSRELLIMQKYLSSQIAAFGQALDDIRREVTR